LTGHALPFLGRDANLRLLDGAMGHANILISKVLTKMKKIMVGL
jgi:hypothetical protein